jgi:hypothetical protein
LIAPKACISIDGFHDTWTSPYGSQLSWQGAQPIFDFLDVSEHNAMFMRDGYHDQNAQDWRVLVDYCDKIFYGKAVETEFNKVRFDKAEVAKLIGCELDVEELNSGLEQ